MKYKDYLLIPILGMYLLYASCTYIADSRGASGTPNPVASVSPTEICWDKDYWYAEGTRGADGFNLENGNTLVIVDGARTNDEVDYSISNMHLCCSDTGSDRNYDLIFVNELTAYDCVSDTYYQRGDYSSLVERLCSGRFVNEQDCKDYYVFGESGRSTEYFGNCIYGGMWKVSTTDVLSVYDNACQGYMDFSIKYGADGRICAIEFNGVNYIYEA